MFLEALLFSLFYEQIKKEKNELGSYWLNANAVKYSNSFPINKIYDCM